MKRLTIGRVLRPLALALVFVVFFVPFWFLFTASLRESSVLLTYPPKLWPTDATLHNFSQLLLSGDYPFLQWMLNSLLTAGMTTLGVLLVCSLAGYAFARLEFAGRTLLFSIAMSSLMVPAAVTLIPQFLIVKSLGLINTLAGIALPGIGSAFGVFLMRQFMEGIPVSITEAALVDGCNQPSIYARIMLPMVTPAMGVLAIFTFMNQWNNLIWPLIIIQVEPMKTLQVGIAGLRGISKTPWGLVMAASALSFLPVLCVFLVARERFVEGLTAGAVKG